MIHNITVLGEQPDIVEDMSALPYTYEVFERFEVTVNRNVAYSI